MAVLVSDLTLLDPNLSDFEHDKFRTNSKVFDRLEIIWEDLNIE
jgi:hypothetical protein